MGLSWQNRGLVLITEGEQWSLELNESICGLLLSVRGYENGVRPFLKRMVIIILLIRPHFLSRAPARHTPMPTPISYSVIFLQSEFVLTASGKC